MMLISLPRAVAQWLFLLVCNLVTLPFGLLMVALAIPFRVPGVSVMDGRPIINLPRWAWLFGNDYDGLLGDKRLWWAANCDGAVLFGLLPLLRRFGLALPVLAPESFLAMYWWAAVRNPVNNLRLVPAFYCPVGECVITGFGQAVVKDDPEKGGWQFVVAKRGWRRWYGLYVVHQWSKTRAFVLRFGFKITVADNGGDELIGQTIKINPLKSI